MTDRVRVRAVAAAVNAIMPILANHTAEPIGTMRRKLAAALLDHALDRAPVMARNFGRSP
jgi:hypothetical protein